MNTMNPGKLIADEVRANRAPNYHDRPEMNFSTLKNGMVNGVLSPRKLRYAINNKDGKETDAMVIGSCFHTAILEPHLLHSVYYQTEKKHKRGLGPFKIAQEAACGKTVIAAADFHRASAMAQAVRDNPEVADYLAMNGVAEKEVYAELCGVKCRGKVDYIFDETNLEFKSFRGLVIPEKFKHEIVARQYHIQAPFYMDLAKLRRTIIVAVEKDPPHCVYCHHLSKDTIAIGREQYQAVLKMYKECKATGIWPSYLTNSPAVDLDLPDYAITPRPQLTVSGQAVKGY